MPQNSKIDLKQILDDPDFRALPFEERIKAYDELLPDFKQLPDAEKAKAYLEIDPELNRFQPMLSMQEQILDIGRLPRTTPAAGAPVPEAEPSYWERLTAAPYEHLLRAGQFALGPEILYTPPYLALQGAEQVSRALGAAPRQVPTPAEMLPSAMVRSEFEQLYRTAPSARTLGREALRVPAEVAAGFGEFALSPTGLIALGAGPAAGLAGASIPLRAAATGVPLGAFTADVGAHLGGLALGPVTPETSEEFFKTAAFGALLQHGLMRPTAAGRARRPTLPPEVEARVSEMAAAEAPPVAPSPAQLTVETTLTAIRERGAKKMSEISDAELDILRQNSQQVRDALGSQGNATVRLVDAEWLKRQQHRADIEANSATRRIEASPIDPKKVEAPELVETGAGAAAAEPTVEPTAEVPAVPEAAPRQPRAAFPKLTARIQELRKQPDMTAAKVVETLQVEGYKLRGIQAALSRVQALEAPAELAAAKAESLAKAAAAEERLQRILAEESGRLVEEIAAERAKAKEELDIALGKPAIPEIPGRVAAEIRTETQKVEEAPVIKTVETTGPATGRPVVRAVPLVDRSTGRLVVKTGVSRARREVLHKLLGDVMREVVDPETGQPVKLKDAVDVSTLSPEDAAKFETAQAQYDAVIAELGKKAEIAEATGSSFLADNVQLLETAETLAGILAQVRGTRVRFAGKGKATVSPEGEITYPGAVPEDSVTLSRQLLGKKPGVHVRKVTSRTPEEAAEVRRRLEAQPEKLELFRALRAMPAVEKGMKMSPAEIQMRMQAKKWFNEELRKLRAERAGEIAPKPAAEPAIDVAELDRKLAEFSEPDVPKRDPQRGAVSVEGDPPKAQASMYFKYEGMQRPGVTASTTFEAVQRGERTSTTRFDAWGSTAKWDRLKPGDKVRFFADREMRGSSVDVEVTEVKRVDLRKMSPSELEAWSQAEGWSLEAARGFARRYGSGTQVRYRLPGQEPRPAEMVQAARQPAVPPEVRFHAPEVEAQLDSLRGEYKQLLAEERTLPGIVERYEAALPDRIRAAGYTKKKLAAAEARLARQPMSVEARKAREGARAAHWRALGAIQAVETRIAKAKARQERLQTLKAMFAAEATRIKEAEARGEIEQPPLPRLTPEQAKAVGVKRLAPVEPKPHVEPTSGVVDRPLTFIEQKLAEGRVTQETANRFFGMEKKLPQSGLEILQQEATALHGEGRTAIIAYARGLQAYIDAKGSPMALAVARDAIRGFRDPQAGRMRIEVPDFVKKFRARFAVRPKAVQDAIQAGDILLQDRPADIGHYLYLAGSITRVAALARKLPLEMKAAAQRVADTLLTHSEQILANQAQIKRLSGQVLGRIRKSTEWTKHTVELLDNPEVSPLQEPAHLRQNLAQERFKRPYDQLDATAKAKIDETADRIWQNYTLVREIYDRQRVRIRDAGRAAMTEAGYSAEKIAEAFPNNWGIEAGYYHHAFPGTWAVFFQKGTGPGGQPVWDVIDTGWRQVSERDALLKAQEYREQHPGARMMVQQDTIQPSAVGATPMRKLGALTKMIREASRLEGDALEAAVVDVNKTAGAMAYGPLRPQMKTTGAVMARRRDLAGWSRDFDTWRSNVLHMERYIQLLEARPKLLNARNRIAEYYGLGDIQKPSEIRQFAGWRLLGMVDRSIQSFEGYPTFVERMFADAPGLRSLERRFPGVTRRTWSAINQAEALMKLGLNVAAGLTNATQTFTNTFPGLGPKWFGHAMKEFATNRKAYASLFNELGLHAQTTRVETSGLREYLTGHFAGELRHAPGKALLGAGFDVAMMPFHMPEFFNRGVAAIGAYNRARARGAAHRDAVLETRRFIDRTHATYAEWAMPQVLRELPGPVRQFANWTFKQFEFMLGLRGAEVPYFLAASMALYGISGMPGIQLVDDVVKQATGISFLKAARISESLPARVAAKGALGEVAGIDISRSAGFGEFLYPRLNRLGGPFVSDVRNLSMAWPALMKRIGFSVPGSAERERALREFMVGLSPNIRRQVQVQGKALVDVRDGSVVIGDLTTYEQWLLRLGLQPERVSVKRDILTEMRQEYVKSKDQKLYHVQKISQAIEAASQPGADAAAMEKVIDSAINEAIEAGYGEGLSQSVTNHIEAMSLTAEWKYFRLAPKYLRERMLQLLDRSQAQDIPEEPE